MRHKTQEIKLIYRVLVMAFLALTIAITWFTMARPATGQGDDTYLPVVVPGIVTPDPTAEPLYIDMQHGQRMYVRCGVVPGESDPQPAGQFASPQFGVDVMVLDCNAFGSARVGE